jgi:phage-related minor tail protein
MSPENQSSAEEAFRALDAQLAALSSAAKSLRENRPSWADNMFHPGRRARQEADFSAALVSALKEIRAAIRNAMTHQNSKVTELEGQFAGLRANEFPNLQTELREAQQRLAREQTDAANRTNQHLEQLTNDYAAKIEQLAAGQKDLANEFRERIQHLLDEQRVSIRQLALKTSEDAVLSDRARRATELKLEELAKRLPPAPPA